MFGILELYVCFSSSFRSDFVPRDGTPPRNEMKQKKKWEKERKKNSRKVNKKEVLAEQIDFSQREYEHTLTASEREGREKKISPSKLNKYIGSLSRHGVTSSKRKKNVPGKYWLHASATTCWRHEEQKSMREASPSDTLVTVTCVRHFVASDVTARVLRHRPRERNCNRVGYFLQWWTWQIVI